jgi:hypothetical protein
MGDLRDLHNSLFGSSKKTQVLTAAEQPEPPAETDIEGEEARERERKRRRRRKGRRSTIKTSPLGDPSIALVGTKQLTGR